MGFILNTIGIATGVSVGMVIGCRLIANYLHKQITNYLERKIITIRLPFGLMSIIRLEEGE